MEWTAVATPKPPTAKPPSEDMGIGSQNGRLRRALMRPSLLMSACALPIVGSLSLLAQDNASSGSWSGVIINHTCSPDEAFAEAPKCTETGVRGAQLALYDDTTRQIFILDPQDQAVGHLGDSVTVSGTVERNTLHVASFKPLTDIGLAVGGKAPAFSARDQLGQLQNLNTLKGRNGTVLLFYRSADW